MDEKRRSMEKQNSLPQQACASINDEQPTIPLLKAARDVQPNRPRIEAFRLSETTRRQARRGEAGQPFPRSIVGTSLRD
jgi:hypothetical protein